MQLLAHPSVACITNFTLQEPKVNTFYKVGKSGHSIGAANLG
jgi:hypothetical protein